MPTVTDPIRFLALIEDELGLDLPPDALGTDLDDLPEWDSFHLLRLVTALERELDRPLSISSVLHARSLGEIHAVVTAHAG